MSDRRPAPRAPEDDLAREPERWSTTRSDDDLHGKLGAGFRALAATPVPPPAARPDRVRRSVRPRAWLVLGVATFTLVAVLTGGALAVAKVYRYLRGAPAIAPPTSIAAAEPEQRKNRRHRELARAEVPASAPPAEGGDEGGEAGLLARSFRRLRAEHDPAAALELLDAYDRQWAAGQLSTEAGLARVEALLALGRHREALDVLERRAEVARERPLLRGELRAEAGRCAPALADFAQAERTAPSDVAARAVWDEATCRARLGDAPGAGADFRRYLAVHPAGANAREAQRWLAREAARK
jgi:hypothetical protein